MATQVGASSTQGHDPWHQIDWKACHSNVARLQARIVKATKENRVGKIKALQRLLTHSFSAKAIAVKRVTENRGKKTPGIDGKTLSTPLEKSEMIRELGSRSYRPGPVKRIYIPKASGKHRLRPLGIPQIKDRAMQALHLLGLDPIAETKADTTSFGFRPSRSTADAIEQSFIVLSNGNRAEWILEGDIEACFDELSHQWLLDHVPMDKVILKKWLKAGYVDKGIYKHTAAGSPQGGIISPVLANLTLDGLEKLLKATPALKRRKVNLVRYADDFIITGGDPELLEQSVRPIVEKFLAERGLRLSPSKTRITHISAGFDFLGQNIRKYNGKLLIKPSQGSCKGLIKKVKKCLRAHRMITPYELIKELNPLIRGWAYYHRHVVSKDIFRKMDAKITRQVWSWAKRRHPKKSRGWIKREYFSPGQNWGRFRGEEQQSDGTKKTIMLEAAGRVSIKRHVKVRGDANPYAAEWQAYFASRQERKAKQRLPRRGFFQQLWQAQKGHCPLCQTALTEQTQWDIHHITPQKEGGKDILSNLVLLHPNCHRQLHSNPAVARSIGSKIGRIRA